MAKKSKQLIKQLITFNQAENNNYLNIWIEETKQYFDHYEFGVGLEYLIENLYEEEIKLTPEIIEKLKELMIHMNFENEDFKILENLKR